MLNEHTCKNIIFFDVSGPIIEADDALKPYVRLNRISVGNRQPAGDFVIIVFSSLGGGVGRHTISYFQVVARPGHADVIWVETRGHTDQRLVLYIPVFVLTFWSLENFHSRWSDWSFI